jgi:hypothetical protein
MKSRSRSCPPNLFFPPQFTFREMTRTQPDALVEFDEFEAEREDSSRWVIVLILNLLLVLLGSTAITIAFRFLDIHDTRTLYNPWTYVVLIPLSLAIISKMLSLIASRLVERSLQLAFLTSVLIHLLLLTSAGNIVIFSKAWPELFDSLTEQRQRLERLQTLQAPQYAEHSFHPRAVSRPEHLRPVPTPIAQDQSVHVSPSRSELADRLSDSSDVARVMSDPTSDDSLQQSSPIPTDDLTSSAQEAPPSSIERLRSELLLDQPAPLVMETVNNPSAPQTSSPQSITNRKVLDRLLQRLSSVKPEPSISPEGDMNEVTVNRTAGGRPGQPARQSHPQSGPVNIESPQWNVQPQSASLNRLRPDNRLPEMDASASPLVSEVESMRSAAWDRSTRIPPGLHEESIGKHGSTAEDGNAALLDLAELAGSEGHIERAMLGANAATDANSFSPIARLPSSPPEVDVSVDPNALSADRSIDSDPASLSPHPGSQDLMADQTSLRRRNSLRDGQNFEADPSSIGSPPPDLLSAVLDRSVPAENLGANGKTVAGLSSLYAKSPSIMSPPEISPELELAMTSSVGLTRRNLDIRSAPPVASTVAKPAFQQRLDRLREELIPSSSADPTTRQPTAMDLAIERGLEFLARHQRNDGSWRLQDFDSEVLIRSDTAATGLALLAFQGAGYTHLQSRYAPQVNRAIRFLIDNQKEDGDLYIPQDPASDQNAWLYSHSIAALALCESFGMTQDERLRPAAQRAVDFMVSSQDIRRGGWRYRPAAGSDTSVTGWFMMALKSGQLAGLEIPSEIYGRIQQYMDDAQVNYSTRHLYRYNPFAPDTVEQRHGLRPTAVMTSVGLLSRLYLGWDRQSPEITRGAQFLLEHLPQHGTRGQSLRDTYYWYYATQVIYQVGGEPWQRWQANLYPLLIEHQETTGEYAGSWSPDHPVPDLWSRYGGRLYVTTMNLLSLEVSYRHLPLYEATAAN